MQTTSIETIERREEYTTLSKNAGAAEAWAAALVVKNEEDERKAIAAAAKIKAERERGDTMRKYLIEDPMRHIKKINDLFMPALKSLAGAYDTARGKLSDYHAEAERKADEARKKELAKLEAGTTTAAKAAKKLEKVAEPQRVVRADEATAGYRMLLEIEIADEAKVPREYLMPDMQKIKAVALALHKTGGAQIPGIKVTEKKVPSIRARF